MGYDYSNRAANNPNNPQINDFGNEYNINSKENIIKIEGNNFKNAIKNENKFNNISSEGNINEMILKGINDINSNLLSLKENDNILFESKKNSGCIFYDNVLEEMKFNYINKKNKKFKYEIKNEIKNTLIKPILDSLKTKDNEISELKLLIEDLKKYSLDNNNQIKKEFDIKIKNIQNKNNELSSLFETHNTDMKKVLNKYDCNFNNLNRKLETINLNQVTIDKKNNREIENLKNYIPNEINSLKMQINSIIEKKETNYNSKFDNILKFNKEYITKYDNLRKQFEAEIKVLKNNIEKFDNEQKQLKIKDENKTKELTELKEKIIINNKKIDKAINEIEIINNNSEKNMISIVNEKIRKFNSIFQKEFSFKKQKSQNKLKLELFHKKKFAQVGLTNIGNNCYLNSVLQILKNIPKFIYHFYLMDENSDKFLLTLKNLFLKICFSKEKSFSPKEFKEVLGKENKKFSGDNQYDSTIFYISLLNLIQKKLCNPNCNYQKLNMELFRNKSLYEKYKIWKENYLSKNGTFILDYFYTFYVSEIQCNSCKTISHSFQCTNFLDFPIITQNSEVKNLEECFSNYQMIKSLINECSECNNDKFSQHFKILELPPILMINLKRVGEGEAHFNDIEIPFQLDMEKLINNKTINSIYELRGFIKHSGDEFGGHNYAFCKNMFDDKWYEYNDSHCIPINGSPELDKIFLLCYVKIGCDIQDVSYLKKILDSTEEKNFLNNFKNNKLLSLIIK